MLKNFNNKKEILQYIKNSFKGDLILIRGSTAYQPAKRFSDFDVEAYGKKPRKPDYEIAFLKEKPILISTYFYKFKPGKKIQKPKNVKILHGKYNDKINPDFSKDTYAPKEKIKKEFQLLVDSFFKYLRHGNKKDLEPVQKRLK